MEDDLCLMYGVQNTKQNLKYQGLVWIATIDRVVMEGYINGRKLKRLYVPLTRQTLQAIY